jgi:predicted nucleotidyltransferase
LQLALRVLPVPTALDLVLRANPAVEFAGDDEAGVFVVLSPFAEPSEVLRLTSTIDRIVAGRTPAPPITMMDREQLRSAMREDPAVRSRGLMLRVITGSSARTFPDPDRHPRPDGVPLGRLHPTLGRIPRAEIEALADRLGIARIRVFGSAVRSDFRPDSDIDVLIELKPGVSARMATELAVQRLLEAAFHRDVDVVTPGSLDAAIRERASQEGVAIHG